MEIKLHFLNAARTTRLTVTQIVIYNTWYFCCYRHKIQLLGSKGINDYVAMKTFEILEPRTAVTGNCISSHSYLDHSLNIRPICSLASDLHSCTNNVDKGSPESHVKLLLVITLTLRLLFKSTK